MTAEKPSLFTVRQTISLIGYQPFDSNSTELAIRQIIKPRLGEELLAIEERKPLVGKRFKDIFDRLGISHPDQIDSAVLSSFYVTDAGVDDFQIMALIAQERKHPHLFILFFDTDYGVNMTVGALISSPNSKHPHNEPDTSFFVSKSAEDIENNLGLQTNIGDQAEAYLQIRERHLRLEVLLDEDPTGFLLIGEVTKELSRKPNRVSTDHSFPPFLVPEFVATGANFAESLYRAIYPVSERILKTLK